MTEWCGPTAELSNQSLKKLLDRTRRSSIIAATGGTKKPTDAQAPLTDPWFEDSQPIQVPETDPAKPVEIEPRERKERTGIPKVVVRGPVVYPVYRSAHANVMRVVVGLGVAGAAIATLAMY